MSEDTKLNEGFFAQIQSHTYAPSKGNDEVCHICGHGPEEHVNFIFDK